MPKSITVPISSVTFDDESAPVRPVASHAKPGGTISVPMSEVTFDKDEPSVAEMVVPMGLRIGGAVLGSVTGFAVGGPPGAIIGGGVGSGLGEAAAEKYEGRELNPTQIAVQTALGAIPMGKAPAALSAAQLMARRAVQGGGMGAASTVATQLAEDGTLPSAEQVVTGGTLGAVLGAGGGALEARAIRRAPTPVDIPPTVAPKQLPPGTRFIVTESGEVLARGADMPTPVPSHDTSYVRGVDASGDVQPGVIRMNRTMDGAYVPAEPEVVGIPNRTVYEPPVVARRGQRDLTPADVAESASGDVLPTRTMQVTRPAVTVEEPPVVAPEPFVAPPMNKAVATAEAAPVPARTMDVAATPPPDTLLPEDVLPRRTMGLPKGVKPAPIVAPEQAAPAPVVSAEAPVVSEALTVVAQPPRVEAPTSKAEFALSEFNARKAARTPKPAAEMPTDAEALELQRIVNEMEAMPFTPTSYAPLPDMTADARQSLETSLANEGSGQYIIGTGMGAKVVTPGAAGAPVFDDILRAQPGMSAPTRTALVKQIRNYLATGKKTNGVEGALAVARKRMNAAGSEHVQAKATPMPWEMVRDDAGNQVDAVAHEVRLLNDDDLVEYHRNALSQRLDDWSDPDASEATIDALEAEMRRRGLGGPNANEQSAAQSLAANEVVGETADATATAARAAGASEVVDAGPSGGVQPRLPEGVGDAARAERPFALESPQAKLDTGAPPDRTGMLFNPSELVQGPRRVTPTEAVSRFSDMFDESGFIAAPLAAKVAGGVGGAAYGAATGEDVEDRLSRAALFGAAGAMGGAALLSRRGATATAQAARTMTSAVPDNVATMAPRGAAPPVIGRSGRPLEDGLRGIDPLLNKFSNPLVREGIQNILEEHNGFARQRRGVIDTDTLKQFAAEVEVNVKRVLPKGTALNAEQITAYAIAVRKTQERVEALAAKVANNTATDADIVALHAAKAEADAVTKSLMGARSEAGRALAALNFWRGILDTGDTKLIREAAGGPGVRKDAAKIADALANGDQDAISKYRRLQALNPSTVMDKVRAYYYANILSGVKTHERNLLGNAANILTELAVHPVAAGIDAAKALATGAKRTITMDEFPSKTVGAVVGLQQGFKDALFTMQHGMSPRQLQKGMSAAEVGKLDVPLPEFAGGWKNPFNVPGRLLNASDNLFRSIARNMEAAGMAHTQAKNEGLVGDALKERMAELLAGQTPEGAAIKEAADAFATRAVFQEQTGKFASWLQSGVRQIPALSFVLPFVKTPANIMRQGLEFSAAGAAMKAARQGGRAGTQAQARAALGTTAAGFLAWLAATNQLSGEGPSDPAEKAALMESGWRPNSVKIGDTWVNYNLFQPVSVQASIVANAFEAWRDQGMDKSAADTAAATVFRSIGAFTSQSFLSGLFDFVSAMDEAKSEQGVEMAARSAGRTATGLIPMVGAVRSAQQAADPTVRRPSGVAEQIKGALPGLSQSVASRIDRWGEDVVREGSAIQRVADPFNTSSVKRDPVADELMRLGVNVSLPDPDMTLPKGVKLTDAQKLDLQRRKGRAVRVTLEGLMQSRRWAQLDDDTRRDVVDREIDKARRDVSQRFRKELTKGRK